MYIKRGMCRPKGARSERRAHRVLGSAAAAIAGVALVAGAAGEAQGGVHTWIGTSSGDFSNPANWAEGVAPASADDNYLRLNVLDPDALTLHQDAGNPLRAWALELLNTSTFQQTLTGQPIEFANHPSPPDPASPAPVLAQRFSTPATSGGWQIQNDLILTDDTTFGSPATAATVPVTLSGSISGAGRMNVVSGRWRLTGPASGAFTGGADVSHAQLFVTGSATLGTGAVRVSGSNGRLVFGSGLNAQGAPNSITLDGGFVQFNGPSTAAVARIAPASNGVLALTGSAGGVLDFANKPNVRLGTWLDTVAAQVTFSGGINLGLNTVYRFGGHDNAGNDSQTSDTLTITTELTNAGSTVPRSVQIGGAGPNGTRGGKVRITYPFNNYTGGTVVEAGTSADNNLTALVFNDVPTGLPLGTGPVTVKGTLLIEGATGTVAPLNNAFHFAPGGVLMFNNIVGSDPASYSPADGADRWGNNKPVSLDSAQIIFQTISPVSPVEQIGAVTIAGGSRMTIDHRGSNWAGPGYTMLAMQSLQRAGRGTLLLEGKQVGNGGSQSGLEERNRYQIGNNAQHLDAEGMLKPYLIGDDLGIGGSGAPMLPYTPGLGHFLVAAPTSNGVPGDVRTANFLMTNGFSASVANEKVNWSGPPASGGGQLQQSESAWVLRMHPGATLQIPGTLHLAGGGLIMGGGTGDTISGGTLTFGGGELVVFANLNATSIASDISGQGGLTKFGKADLLLKGNNAFGAGLVVNEGRVIVGHANALAATVENRVRVEASGTLELAGYSQNFWSLGGAGRVVNSAATPATITLNDPFAASESTLVDTRLMDGDASGTRPLSFNYEGSRILTLTGASGYSGLTRVDRAPVIFAGSNTFAGDYLTATPSASLHFARPYDVGRIDGVGQTLIQGTEVRADRVRQSNLTLQGLPPSPMPPPPWPTARLTIKPGSSGAHGASQAGVIFFSGPSQIDLTDNMLVVTGMHAPAVEAHIASGRAGGLWTGQGIVTSMPDARTGLRSLGIATADQADVDSFGGLSVEPTDVLVMYTYAGDANLDGTINIDDYGRIDANVSQSGSVFGWYNGDFNYDGAINIDDYGIIDGNISNQGTAFPTATATATGVAGAEGVSGDFGELGRAVPEPGSLSLLALGALGLIRRRAAARPVGPGR